MAASFPTSVKNFGADRVTGDYIPASDTNDMRAEIVAIETALLGGWLGQTETWTYASASTFTVPGDRTAYYTKGRRLKWVQTTTKYGVVASSSYSAPNTIVTILVNTDYTIANAAITSPAVSDLDNPQGWPDWFTWSPTYSASGAMTYTGVTTQYALYRANGRTIQFMIRASGTTGGAANNEIRATSPVTPVSLTGPNLAFIGHLSETNVSGKCWLDTSTGLLSFAKADGTVWSIGASKVVYGEGFYEW